MSSICVVGDQCGRSHRGIAWLIVDCASTVRESVTCTAPSSSVFLMGSPLRANTASIALFCGSTSACNCVRLSWQAFVPVRTFCAENSDIISSSGPKNSIFKAERRCFVFVGAVRWHLQERKLLTLTYRFYPIHSHKPVEERLGIHFAFSMAWMVCCAISRSSFVRTTRTFTGALPLCISAILPKEASFFAQSMAIPRCSKPSHARSLITDAFSPMPPVNTIASTLPSTATYAPMYFLMR